MASSSSVLDRLWWRRRYIRPLPSKLPPSPRRDRGKRGSGRPRIVPPVEGNNNRGKSDDCHRLIAVGGKKNTAPPPPAISPLCRQPVSTCCACCGGSSGGEKEEEKKPYAKELSPTWPGAQVSRWASRKGKFMRGVLSALLVGKDTRREGRGRSEAKPQASPEGVPQYHRLILPKPKTAAQQDMPRIGLGRGEKGQRRRRGRRMSWWRGLDDAPLVVEEGEEDDCLAVEEGLKWNIRRQTRSKEEKSSGRVTEEAKAGDASSQRREGGKETR